MPVSAKYRKDGIPPVPAKEARIEAIQRFDPGFYSSGDAYEIAG
jgi:hypothetical protein